MKNYTLFFLILISFNCLSQEFWTESDEQNLKKIGEKWIASKFPRNLISTEELKIFNHSGFFDTYFGGDSEFQKCMGRTVFGKLDVSVYKSKIGIFLLSDKGGDFLRKKILPLATKGNVESILFLFSHNYWSSRDGIKVDFINYNAQKAIELLDINISKSFFLKESLAAKWAILTMLDKDSEALEVLMSYLRKLDEQESLGIRNLISSSESIEFVDAKFVAWNGDYGESSYQDLSDSQKNFKIGSLEIRSHKSGKSFFYLNNFGLKFCVDGDFLYLADLHFYKSRFSLLREINNYSLLQGYSYNMNSSFYPLFMSKFYQLHPTIRVDFERFCNGMLISKRINEVPDAYKKKLILTAFNNGQLELAKKLAPFSYSITDKAKFDLVLAKYYYNTKYGDDKNRESFNIKEFDISKSECDSLKKYLNFAIKGDKNGDAHFFAAVATANCNCFNPNNELSWELLSKAYAMGNSEVSVIYDDYIKNPKSKVSQKIISYFGQNPGGAWRGQIECERCKKLYYPKTNFADQIFSLNLENSKSIAPSLLNFETAYISIQDDWTHGYWCSKNCAAQGSSDKRKQVELDRIRHENEAIGCAYCSKKVKRMNMISMYQSYCYESTIDLYLNPFSETKDIYRVCSRKCEHEYSKLLCKKNGLLPIPE